MIVIVGFMVSTPAFAQTVHDSTLYEAVKQGSNFESTRNSPIDIGFDSRRNTMHLLNNGSNSISVISTKNYTKIVEDIPVGRNPTNWAVSHDGANINKIFVSNSGSNSISIISAENNTKIGEDIQVGWNPTDIAVDESSGITDTVYVANSDFDRIFVISGENHTILAEIFVGSNPTEITINPYTNLIYVANTGSSSVSVIDGSTYTKIGDIPVGRNPKAIAFDLLNSVYVANSGSDTISVISGDHYGANYSRIMVEEIKVGSNPSDIAIDALPGKAYVANTGSDTVSVINTLNNTKIGEDIPVGRNPISIDVHPLLDAIYVANTGSDTVSVISTKNYTKIVEDIPVGRNPADIDFNRDTNGVIVANGDSDGISVIDNVAGRVVEGVTFHVNPFNSGNIVCNDLSTPSPDDLTRPSPVGQYIYVYSGTKCTAKPNEGFSFSSWEENLRENAKQVINVSRTASSLDSFLEFLHLKPSDKPEAALSITRIGSFTANFKEAPPPLPQEFWVQMYAIIGTVVTALFIPSIIGWTKSKRDVGKLNYYHKQIASLYGDGELDENDIEALDRLTSRAADAYSEGKLNEKHYESLRNETSILYEKIFRKRINVALDKNNSPSDNKTTKEQLAQIRDDVRYAYSEGKINDKHYTLLNEDISKLDGKDSNNNTS